jgi:hypothetical protein
MTQSPYAIPAEELVSRARVPVTDQVEIQADAQQPPGDWSAGVLACGEGGSGDPDGD